MSLLVIFIRELNAILDDIELSSAASSNGLKLSEHAQKLIGISHVVAQQLKFALQIKLKVFVIFRFHVKWCVNWVSLFIDDL